ncbi:unnamed protein product [Phytomonas sp. Hart1]|nr:unnamed protein product [Phytomonas sp. Hart1]|eukprot:CCW67094.1 unnamed protein product [Phytomonas sp. isolate Hart1]
MSDLSRRLQSKRLNFIKQASSYLDFLLKKQKGLKVLLCDEHTFSILNVVYSQHQLLQNNVVLVDKLFNEERFPMKYFSCIIFCQPSKSSLKCIFQELAEANFSSYSIFFSYLLDSSLLECLAIADQLNLVTHVGEIYLDSIPITEYVCICQLTHSLLNHSLTSLMNPLTYVHWNANSFSQITKSIVSMMLLTERRPVIRYRSDSKVVKKIAEEVASCMNTMHRTFPDHKSKESVLVILDRMDDPLTPLLMPWTYEAMIHELIGFQNGNEIVIDSLEASPEERHHVLTPQTDSFFEKHRYGDWGQVCGAVSEMINAYKEINNIKQTIVSIEEIKNFMARFPESRQKSVQVFRHAGITSQLVAEVKGRNLTHLSALEQDIITRNDITEHSRLMLETVQDPKTDLHDALRITMIYNLRYEKASGNIISRLKQELENRQCAKKKIDLIDRLIEYAGQQRRSHEIFKLSTGHLLKSVLKSVRQPEKDVQNVLTQHTPLLKKLINRLYNGTLSEEKYPIMDVPGSTIPISQMPYIRTKDIIIAYAGGITFTEAMLLWQINQGLVDNNSESLMNIKISMSRRLVGNETVAPSEQPYTAKIEAQVALISTAMINSKMFIHSLDQ